LVVSVGPYRVLERLGAGGMGEVFLAEDTRLNRKVALKSMTESWAQEPDARERLLREARVVAKLNHPNIAAIYDILEVDENAHIVMEFVEGQTLAERLRKGRLPHEQVVQIGIQLGDALANAHARGIIHRDLKPGNIHLTPEGKVKVLDFGLAKVRAARADGTTPTETPTESLTKEGHVIGTPAYMSPEQLRGQEADVRSDVYSFGVVLYELATGSRPFEGRDFVSLALAVITESAPLAHDLEVKVPKGLSAIIARAMAKDPSDRYASASDMLADLRNFAEALEQPTASTLRSFFLPLSRLALPARTTTATFSAALLVIILGLVFWRLGTFQRAVAGPRPVIVVLPFDNLSGDPGNDHLGVGIADTLITDLAAIPAVTVVSRSAAEDGPGKSADTRKVARDTGATFVVRGSVQRTLAKLLVTVNLLRPDESLAWGKVYEDELAGIFGLQRRIAEGLTETLRLNLSAAEREHITRPLTKNLDAFAEYSRGLALLELREDAGKIDGAIDSFSKAIGMDPKFALAHAALGEAYWFKFKTTKQTDWTEKATASIVEALRLEPEQAAVRISLALVYQGTGRAVEAAEELRRVLSFQPGNEEAHRLLGDLLVDEGRTAEAITEFQKAIELRPGYWRNSAKLGYAYLLLGRYPDAIAQLKRAIGLKPDSSVTLQMLGSVYQRMGDKASALENYGKAIQLRPVASAYSNIGMIHYEAGRFEEAARAFEQAITLEPKVPTYHRNVGDAYRRLGRREEATASYLQAAELTKTLLQINPKDALGLARLAVLEAKLGRRQEAAEHAASAVALVPTNGDVLYRVAVVHALAGEHSQALAILREAVKQGYSVALARTDDDLASVRDLPDFKVLLEGSPHGSNEGRVQ